MFQSILFFLQRIGFENELLKTREQASDLEAELKVKVSSLETEVKALEKSRQQDRQTAQQNMVSLPWKYF